LISKRLTLWLIPAIGYLGFLVWYTDFAGPLTETETQRYLAYFVTNGADEQTVRRMTEFMAEDTGSQFVMVNILDIADNPPVLPATGPGASGSELLGHYMEHMYPALLSRACHPIYAGRAVFEALDLQGIAGAGVWDQAALMRYRSRRDLLEIATNPEFSDRHGYKMAGLDKTIAFPVENVLFYHDLRMLLALILFAFVSLVDLLIYRRAK